MLNEISVAKSQYDRAVKLGMGVKAAQDRLKNVLFAAVEDIVKLMGDNAGMVDSEELTAVKLELAKAREDIKSLQAALDEADEEYAKLKARKGGGKANANTEN